MSLTIATNTSALGIANSLRQNSVSAGDKAQNLASGSRITSPAVDAAAFAIGGRLQGLVDSMEQARRNASQGSSLVQVASGGAQEIVRILDRMKVLTSIAASDGVDMAARALADKEFQKLIGQIDNISDQTRFNGVSLLGTGNTVSFQINTEDTDTVDLILPQLAASTLSVDSEVITSSTAAQTASSAIDAALNTVRDNIADLGAFQAQLNSSIRNLGSSIENAKAAKSSFVDANVADEMIEKTKLEMLLQTGFSALASTFRNAQQVAAFVTQN